MSYTFENRNLHPNISYLSTMHNDYFILMKNGNLYEYFKQVGSKEEPEIENSTVHYIFFKNKSTQRPRLFGIISTPKGILVTDQVSIGQKLRSGAKEFYFKTLYHITYSQEDSYVELVLEKLGKDFLTATIEKKPPISFACSDNRTWKRFKEAHQKYKQKPLKVKSVRLIPDGIIHGDGKNILMEAEKTFHNEHDFLWKLFKIKAVERKFHKILFIFTRENFYYHAELIALFEHHYGKFQRLYYTTVEDVLFNEHDIQKHI